MGYEIVTYRSEFRGEVLDLQRHLWSQHAAVRGRYMEWKHENNPYLDAPRIYLALSEGKVVGMRGVYGSQWRAGPRKEVLPVSAVGDLVIAPEHRDKGLYTRIMEFVLADQAYKGVRYLFSLSASTLTQLGAMAMGWRSIGVLEGMIWRRRAGKLDNDIHRMLRGEEKADPFAAFDRNVGGRFGGKDSRIALEDEPRPEQMAAFVAGMERDDRLRHDKSESYLRWRFANPLSTYRFLFREGLEGYLVLQASEIWDPALVRIVDWEAADLRILKDLLQTATRLGRFERLSIKTVRFEREMEEILRGLGFVQDKLLPEIEQHKPMILVRPVLKATLKESWTCGGLDLMDPENWDMRPVYSDGV